MFEIIFNLTYVHTLEKLQGHIDPHTHVRTRFETET